MFLMVNIVIELSILNSNGIESMDNKNTIQLSSVNKYNCMFNLPCDCRGDEM